MADNEDIVRALERILDELSSINTVLEKILTAVDK